MGFFLSVYFDYQIDYQNSYWLKGCAVKQNVVGTTATASQLEFIDLIVQYLTENGVMDAARLYESPFTDISQQGPEALFLPVKVTEMVRVLDEIRERAAA